MPADRPLRVAVLISGRGSNMAALLKATQAPEFPAEIVCVVSNKASAAGLETARAAGVPTAVISHRDYADRESFDAALDAALRDHGAEMICLAGFMRLLTTGFIERWHDRILNIHPSLLPAFRGLDTHRRAIEAGCKLHGCTVHIVRPELDEGPVIAQAAVPVLDDDDPDRLAARVLEQEHRLYPAALRWFAEGRVEIRGMRVRIAGESHAAGVMTNPIV